MTTSTTSYVETFRAAFEAVAGQVHLAPTEAEINEILKGVFATEKPEVVALAALSETLITQIAGLCKEQGIQVLQPPYNASELPDIIDTAQIGITGCAFGIAETGTLAEVALDDAIRLVSSIPRTHVGIVRTEDLVGTLMESSTSLRRIFETHPAGVTVSYLSGPSRTGDIEMKLTLGVHGPEKAHAILLGAES